ncbi:phage tail tube protein [Sphingobium sp. WTD-1]|uniref:phage tail tube protein n=1 Tax=Sphingobium sp. WTD-1 TaxID=2979467 RepID=UPI0024DE355D|nr:phage tail tube protein [Sphingobium sp. WTD-1]WIA56017.1 phage tail tube protein [Sphingobium sp. WTD-1]
MALVSSSDITSSIIAETVFGTTPTATATRYELPLGADAALLTASATTIASPTKRPNRASNGSRRGMVNPEGSLDIRFQRHAFMDILLQSALSGTFATNVLKAGTTDSSFSVIHKLASDMYKTYAGLMVNGFSISTTGNDEVTSTWNLMGASVTNGATDNALSVTAITGTTEFVASEVQSITVGGQTLSIAELTFETNLDRTRRPVLGSNTGLAFGVNGTRTTTITVRAYRESLAIDTAITGLAQAVSFDIGTTGGGYRIQAPAAYGDIPVDSISDGSAFVTITFTAGYDATAGTDLVITKL